MLKAEINKGNIEATLAGPLKEICTDLACLLSTVNKKLSEQDKDLGYIFRIVFASAFMNGVCFDDDPEHMTHYVEEGRRLEKKNTQLNEVMGDFLDFLKGHLEALENLNKAWEDNKDDEAE